MLRLKELISAMELREAMRKRFPILNRTQDKEFPKVEPYTRVEDSEGYITYRQEKKKD